MKYIYFKGLIRKKRLFIMFISTFIILINLLFILGYINAINVRIHDSQTKEENRTVDFYSESFDLSKYMDVLEDYNVYGDNYSLVFINYEESQDFIKKNRDKVTIAEKVMGYNEKTLFTLRVLKISSYVLVILFFIITIVFQIHFINSSNKEIYLYHILGLPIKRIMFIYNSFISVFLIILSIIIYTITKFINANILNIENLMLIILIFVLNLIISFIINNKLYLKK
ncbi:MAG: hypothetical protein J5982_03695 [Bacilli bacterium]|nr:hypothetical protein [Bacilli bacterium]